LQIKKSPSTKAKLGAGQAVLKLAQVLSGQSGIFPSAGQRNIISLNPHQIATMMINTKVRSTVTGFISRQYARQKSLLARICNT
jgi:hypothetical protein